MRIVVSLLCVMVLSGCSKPKDTIQLNDMPVAVDSTAGLILSDKEYERVNWELFVAIHKEFADRPNSVVYKENFTSNRNAIWYTVARFDINGDHDSPSGGVDTIKLEPSLLCIYTVSIVEGTPESNLKTVAISLDGAFMYENFYMRSPYSDGYEKTSDGVEIDTLFVNFSTPTKLSRDQLYLKARVSNLTEDLLSQLTKDELGFLRNEIFARHGHTFKTQKMIDHFSKMDWYHATVADASVYLNEYEKRNVDLIKSKEI